jgi:monofunctional glycosyltransferase
MHSHVTSRQVWINFINAIFNRLMARRASVMIFFARGLDLLFWPCVVFCFIAALSCAFLLDAYVDVNPSSVPMLLRRYDGLPVQQEWISLDRISPALIRAVVAAEDGRFCQHQGVDWTEIRNVLLDEDGSKRGASTIAMQTARNLFLWSSRSYVRKVIEIPLAFIIDKLWGKRRVLEIYLNIAQWGDGIFGAEAAARAYFGVSATKITYRQAILMAASLPAPLMRNPAHPSLRQGRLAGAIKVRMAAQGRGVSCLFLTQMALRG